MWPLYHDALRDSTYSGRHWEAYQNVNQRFAETVAEVAPDGAIVWIHDYHLQLVPQMLRDKRPDVIIGFFFHIPFPPVELFMRLPWRTEIAAGLAACDLVGFQRAINAANFVVVCDDLLGHSARVGAYPISIDVEELEAVAAGRAIRQRSNRFRTRLGEPEVVLLGVDRLDYTKGISQRLRAYQTLLDEGTLDTERCVMVQVATPTREGVEHYQNERREIEQIVSEINGVHGRLGYPAIHYLYQSLPLDELVALYRTGDVMLVTPLRDGMNLVAKEYVTTRLDGDGVLVLSEFAGAADELTDAVLVNPHDDHALREAIVTAVEMHRHERRARMARLREVVRGSDVQGWAERFLADLTATGELTMAAPHLPAADDPVALAAIAADVDAAVARRPRRRRRAGADRRPRLRRRRCCRACSTSSPSSPPCTPVAVVSGRTVEDLGRFGFPEHVEIFGLHGMERRAERSVELADHEEARLQRLLALAADAADRAGDGAWVEVKPASVVLHVREAHPDHGARSADELQRQAEDVTGAHVLPGHGVVELMTRATSKALAVAELRDELAVAARRVRRRRPHRRGGLRGDGRRRLPDPRRPRRHRRPPPPGRPSRGARLPPRPDHPPLTHPSVCRHPSAWRGESPQQTL